MTRPLNNCHKVPVNESCQTPGSDSIPEEIYKEGGSVLTGKFLTLLQLIRVKEQLPQDFKNASIIHIYKWKGNQQTCNNHCRISLLSILGKILVRVLLNHLNNHLEHGLWLESQYSFRKEHGTVDMVFAAREVSGTEHWLLLMVIWPRHLTWSAEMAYGESWQKYYSPEKFTTITRQFHSLYHMAKTHPRHWSFNSGFSSQHLHHLDVTTASLGWSCCPYLRSPLPKELVKRKAKVCETRKAATELCRKLRKGTATSATAATIPCSHCPSLFRA